jgi:hypothetical protein
MLMKMLQLALLNRVPFGKFNRASAFPVATRPERHDSSSSTSLVDKSRRQVLLERSVNPASAGLQGASNELDRKDAPE